MTQDVTKKTGASLAQRFYGNSPIIGKDENGRAKVVRTPLSPKVEEKPAEPVAAADIKKD